MTMQELIKLIEQWAIDRGLDKNGTVEGQLIKTAEEVAELIIGISKDDIDVIKDSIGDVFVTLVIGNMFEKQISIDDFKEFSQGIKTATHGKIDAISELNHDLSSFYFIARYGRGATRSIMLSLVRITNAYHLDFTDCVESAYKEIAGRKGRVIDGTFVKESDLHE